MKSYTLYREYYDLISLLDRKDQAGLLLAITEYMFEDIEPNLNSKQMKIFNNLKRPLDKCKNKSKNAKKEIKTKSNENQNEIKSNSKQVTHQDVNVNVNDNVYVYVENKLNRTLNSSEIELIETWDCYKPYQIEYAVKQTLLARANNLKYTNAILRNIKDKTEDELKENGREEESEYVEIPDYDWLNENN